ncbi:hypothetical protein [Tannockella kyphosi]|uniref:hypothetical protein n=1 Tax=Tannockella kyphosi TaxID=2899121 RepID=UPI0020114CBB|nr:hypothetical protein [Tannockella kyphosi]
MKKIYLASIILCTLILTGCSSEQEIGSSGDDTAGQSEGFVFETEGVSLFIDATVEETVDLLEEEADCFEAASCANDGMDIIYTYDNFVVTFYEENDESIIYLITLTSDLVSTQEGIVIGSVSEDIISAYGEPSSESSSLLSYESETMELRFILVDDAVVSIEYYKLFD